MIALVAVVVMLAIMMVATVVAETLLYYFCWLAATAYAMQQLTTAIRNKTSTHALDVNRIAKSIAVIALL